MLQVAKSQADYNAAACKIWMCKGYKYADNTANVQKYTVGQVVPITFDVRAPHTGVANVSVVRTSDNTVIGSPLISWDVYASNSASIPTSETSFSVTIPDVSKDCTTPGACVLQHFWNAASIDQTYESCIDFVVSGSGSGSASSAPASSAPASSAVKTSSTVVSKSSITTQAAVVASTCACTPVKRDVCDATTVTVTATAPAYSAAGAGSTSVGAVPASTLTVTVTQTETATIKETVTVGPSFTTASTTSASPIITQAAAVSNSSTSCTSTMTITRASALSGYNMTYPATNMTRTSSSLAGAISPANMTAPSNMTIPAPMTTLAAATTPATNATNPLAPIANLTSAIPVSLLTSTIATTLPTAVPSAYPSLTTPSKPLPSDMSLQDLLEWVSYLIGEYEGEKEGEANAAAYEKVKRAIVEKRAGRRFL